ncbi:DUF732 domain-containing protein [Mycobacterium sp.]|uniref:DUF732 domain-containing protein n=1 Tax=Mycobacterium sp. TaxID=1785 RepID=UPI0026014781|nr:DUF732 domain-containing protein [Mycobacterium sp.]
MSGVAVLRGGAATADASQDDQFLALLDQEGIPALNNVSSLVDTAHKVCRALNAGIPADRVVDAMVDYAYSVDPAERGYAPGRLARTEARFIIASVGAFCPNDQSKVSRLVTDPASRWTDSTHRVTGDIRNAVNSRSDRSGIDEQHVVLTSLIGVVPDGQVAQPDPPQIPPPPPQSAHLQAPPPLPVVAPPRPQRVPPPPQQPPPPPVVAPEPGPAAGSGGSGINGGGDGSGSAGGGLPAPPPAPPPPPPAAPAPHSSPGFVRLGP